MDTPPDIRPAHPNERESALRLIFQHLAADERVKRLANAMHLLEAGQLLPDGLLVASNSQGIRGAIVCLPVAGASGLVWPPQVVPWLQTGAIEDALVRTAATWLQHRGAKLGQCLLDSEDAFQALPLEQNGFRHITTLWYMRHDANVPVAPSRSRLRLRYCSYDPLAPELFHQTLLRTYEGTLDCPDVNGIRSIVEIIDGHKADAGREPETWWLALQEECPVGVLLVTESADWKSWEVAYIGVVPEARRRGIGRELMLKAIGEANRAKAEQLTLSVDARNRPAITLYRQLGFERYDSREVYLAIWSPAIR
jgi:ribosomal protein S18 acetylase RimI-like enzyme